MIVAKVLSDDGFDVTLVCKVGVMTSCELSRVADTIMFDCRLLNWGASGHLVRCLFDSSDQPTNIHLGLGEIGLCYPGMTASL